MDKTATYIGFASTLAEGINLSPDSYQDSLFISSSRADEYDEY